jgi:hypothetical protein
MSGNQEAASILAALRATRTSARERQSAMERTIRWGGGAVPPVPLRSGMGKVSIEWYMVTLDVRHTCIIAAAVAATPALQRGGS